MALASHARKLDGRARNDSVEVNALRAEIVRSLSEHPPWLPSRLFYDAHGARLFERICTLPEYYPTRCELQLMRAHLPAIARALGPHCEIIEPGSGEGIKTRRLLAALEQPSSYRPIDVAEAQLAEASRRLRHDFPDLRIDSVLRDFTRPLGLERTGARRVFYFPGSTIGNFPPDQAVELLRGWHDEAGADGQLLIGVDLRKDPAVLESAYNDAAGVTAAFNRNILVHLNHQLGSDFDPGSWSHEAPYDVENGQITMWLRAQADQTVDLGAGEDMEFAAGAAIRTEFSCKYSVDEFQQLAADARWVARNVWLDERRWFSLQRFTVG